MGGEQSKEDNSNQEERQRLNNPIDLSGIPGAQPKAKGKVDTPAPTTDEAEKERIRQLRLERLAKSTAAASPIKKEDSKKEKVTPSIKQISASEIEAAKQAELKEKARQEALKKDEELREKKAKELEIKELKERQEREKIKIEERKRKDQLDEIKRKNEELEKKKKEEQRVKEESKRVGTNDPVSTSQTPQALINTYIHKIISEGFRISLSKGMAARIFMQDLSVDKSMNGKELLFTVEDTTAIILETIKRIGTDNKFRHLYQCYQRIKKNPLSKNVDVEEILNNIISYFSILYTSPEALEVNTTETVENIDMPGLMNDLSMIPPDPSGGGEMIAFLQMLMKSKAKSQSAEERFNSIENEFYAAFIEEGVINSDSEFSSGVLAECKDQVFDLVIRKSFCQLNNLTQLKTLDKVNGVLIAYSSLLSYDGFGEALVNHKYFLPDIEKLNGKNLQYTTIFGRMLSITVWPTENPECYFQGLAKSSQGAQKKMIDNLSSQFYGFYENLQNFIKKLLKNKDIKDRVMLWFRTLINLNKEYFKMMPKFAILSSKGLFLNCLALFLELCDPFTSKPNKFYETFEKVNPHYCATDKYLSLSHIDKICNEKLEEVKADDEEFNFITECFFITHVLIKFSFKKVVDQYNDACKKAQNSISSRDMPMIEKSLAFVYSMDVHLFSNKFKQKLFQFLTFSSIYFCYENSIDKEAIKSIDPYMLPGKIEILEDIHLNPNLSHIYECYAENISKIGMIYRVFSPSTFESSFTFDCLMLFCLFITKTKTVSNPHTRAETLKFICEFAPKYPKFEFQKHEMQLRGLLLTSKICQNYLFETLIELYGDVEKTGSSRQYYEKYHYRLLITCTVIFLLKDKFYQKQIDSIATKKEDVFDKFTHFLISDINDGFQNSLSKLGDIKEYEEAKTHWEDYKEEQKKDMESKFTEDSRVCKWGMQLCRVTLRLCVDITKTEDCRKAFMSEVNLTSFVEGLNYALDMMVSKKSAKIKVNNPKEYFFEPKEITAELIACYSCMGKYEKFINQVVLDPRSYKQSNFQKVQSLIRKMKIMVPADMADEFQEFSEKCKDAYEENQLKETFMNDAPDEFIDQLFCVLMENPVKLPSGNIIDLAQLKKHLLNDPSDPYTRAPLKIEDVEPLPELKAKIEEFRNEKLEAFRQARELQKKNELKEDDDDIDDLE